MPLITELHVRTVLKDGRTVLDPIYHTPPVKAMDVTLPGSGDGRSVMLMSSAPGLLDGDHLQFKIEVGAGTRLHLHTQSYQHLHAMDKGATQHVDISIGEKAVFYYLPHPVVPHRNSRYRGKQQLRLEASSVLCMGEVLSCGRGGGAERFLFDEYRSCTEFYLGGRLCMRDLQWLRPAIDAATGIDSYEGYTHQALFFYLDAQASLEKLSADFCQLLDAAPGIDFGCSRLPAPGLAVRILGFEAEALFQHLQQLATLTPAYLADL
jgi:urease accessory protein